ncbi:MAG: DUF1361 domain-containing protein [Winogradskyella sp.]|uniref:DUF1361 domain-containing protein n=1 Tax=Winogradskyella sp. TaxID=1883156 RepID=UPI000F3C1F1E|nr:DUF1361 domain-containing protein [Winogradskyella sp.]RNC85001.1 MAG: DUF1361 domain-containing protein [Winogradskyella sp.]
MKSLIIKKFETISLLFTALIMSSFLLIFRIKLNKSFFYLFLIWNIVLAFIPYIITMYLTTTTLTKFKLGFWFCIWLLFLPNAPYIVTDFLHLKVSQSHLLWLDILVLLSFAGTGLLLFFFSVNDMKSIISEHFKNVPIRYLTTVIIFLCGFGVYLGRFLRYNSWEMISNPLNLLSDIIDVIIHPVNNSEVWLFTFGYGVFLYVSYRMFNELYHHHQHNPEDN